MAQQTINIGTAANDGTGDPLRDAFDKANDNFTELYGSVAGAGVAASNDTTLAADSTTVPPTQHAVINYVATSVAALVASSPAALDTLKELADALGDDANFAATMTTALAGKAAKELTIEPVAGSTYTFATADAGKHKRFTNGSAIAATVPLNSSDPVPVGTRIRNTAAGAGQVTLTPAVGVTLNSRGSALKSAGQFAVFEIEKVGTDEWDVLGDVTT